MKQRFIRIVSGLLVAIALSTAPAYAVMTDAGKAARAGLTNGVGSISAFTYIALGTSGTTPAAGDTALGAEISTNSLARAAATCTRVTTSVSNDTSQWAYTWTASGASTVNEVGIFNASSAGTMLIHDLIGPITTANGFQLTVTCKVQNQ
jgi:hypothetical protein